MIIPTSGIAVDASHLTKSEVTEYRGVITETGEEIFRKQIKYSSVNCGEYLALLHGIQWVIENDPKEWVIWSDSKTAIAWLNQGFSASSVTFSDMKFADLFLQVYWADIQDIQVNHWNKRDIGLEIPADFGRK